MYFLEALTTHQVADICGVNRTTVGYWVRTGKIQAQRTGKLYKIPIADLRLYLESIGKAIPEALSQEDNQHLDFPTIRTCWDFFEKNRAEGRCKRCAIFKNNEPCFTYREVGSACCTGICIACEYYEKYYRSRIRFIHQIGLPAAIIKGLFIWGGNRPSEELFGFELGEAIGLGIERVVHPDSLEMVISFAKRRTMGDQSTPNYYRAKIKTKNNEKKTVQLLVTPLDEPKGTFLVLFDPL
jgi:excisionase family DNA binding protein/PAS domain S-box-containing protein